MGGSVPLVHLGHMRVALVNNDNGAFHAHAQIGVGDDDGHFQQAIDFGVQATHLAIEPNQILVGFRQVHRCGRSRGGGSGGRCGSVHGFAGAQRSQSAAF